MRRKTRNVRGCRSAAAADDRGSGIDQLRDVSGELVRTDREDGASALDLRKPRVGLYDDRLRGDLRETFHVRQHAVGSESAVETVGVDAERFEKRGDAFNRSAREKLAVLAQRNRRVDRKIAIFLRGDDRGLELEKIAHRLDDDQIGLSPI